VNSKCWTGFCHIYFFFFIDSSISTTIRPNKLNHTQLDDSLSIDRTAVAYALLNEALDISVLEEPTTTNSNKSSITATMTSPTIHIPSPLSNASLDSSSSSVASIDTGNHLSYLKKKVTSKEIILFFRFKFYQIIISS